jgi:hypothetical protein
MLDGVKLWLILRRLLPILAIMGLVVAPLAAPMPAAAMARASPAAMADDMPCCPHENPAMPDCAKACPLMAICLAKCFQNVPVAGASISALRIVAEQIVPANEAQGESLPQAPLPRPPRT